MFRTLFSLLALFMAISAYAAHPKEVVAILGDSNTWTGGDDCSGPYAWTHEWKALYRPASVRSYARSGATWSNAATSKRNTRQEVDVITPDNTIYNQIERLSEAIASGQQKRPTLVIVMAGTNDAWHSRRRPGAFDTTAEAAMASPGDDELLLRAPSGVRSIAQAVRQNILRLRMVAPGARIVLAGPLQSVQAPDDLITRAGEIIEQVGEAMGVTVIRLDRDFELSASEEAASRRLTTDGTHTNVEGAALLGRFLNDRISALTPSRKR